ncbi:MAG TPA: phosphopyruvate hydratase [Dehalococcoidia bacterium]|nr:phosphopyruvate hydratase [Dehalococcoidia bacterium]
MKSSDKIVRVWAREILNFRGDPTAEAEVFLNDGSYGRAAAPAGVSAGTNEVGQLLDGDAKRFGGKGVLKAVQNIREVIAPALKGMPASQQEVIDKTLIELDGTPNKRRLGGNAILAVSLATAHAAAASQNLPLYRYLGGEGTFRLPVPAFDIFCGGSHAENSLDFQEYLVIPAGLSSFREALTAGAAIYKSLIELLHRQGYSVREAGSGPISAPLHSNQEGVEVVAAAIEMAGYKLGEQCFIGIDAATSELYENGKYILNREGQSLTSSELAHMWDNWVSRYPIISIEDAMSEEDWESWQALTKRIGGRVQLVGDDFFTTNPERVRRGIATGAANAVLIKPNQIGTLTETLETISIAHQAGWATMLSTRSGETEDTTIADISVLKGCGQIKTGPPRRQGIIKHNRLLRIEEELGNRAEYAGLQVFKALG